MWLVIGSSSIKQIFTIYNNVYRNMRKPCIIYGSNNLVAQWHIELWGYHWWHHLSLHADHHQLDMGPWLKNGMSRKDFDKAELRLFQMQRIKSLKMIALLWVHIQELRIFWPSQMAFKVEDFWIHNLKEVKSSSSWSNHNSHQTNKMNYLIPPISTLSCK